MYKIKITVIRMFILFSMSNIVHAASISSIQDLEVDGILYTVTFRLNTSFQILFDADNDGAFGGGGSTFNTAPTFWGDSAGASIAADGIASILGNVDTILALGSDRFVIPHSANLVINNTTLTNAFFDDIIYASDLNPATNIDNLVNTNAPEDQIINTVAYATFEATGFTAVPEPPVIFLISLGFLGFRMIRKGNYA